MARISIDELSISWRTAERVDRKEDTTGRRPRLGNSRLIEQTRSRMCRLGLVSCTEPRVVAS